eukprot:Selendium_serpulae@DN5305_c0_g1_i4.p1
MVGDLNTRTVTTTFKTSGENFLHDVHTAIRKKLACQSASNVPPSLQSATTELRDKIKRCVTHGEKFTLLLMGPPGSGKTSALDAATQAVNMDTDGAVEVVKVDAPMHRDDESSVRSIVSQLSHLLGCLDRTKKVLSFQDNLSLLQMLLKDSWSLHKAVVIVLDHFERFCGAGRQTLLYCLFDLLHVAKLQICVIGLTSVLNVTDGLEKRIKSRCNLQRLYIAGPQSVEELTNLAIQRLNLDSSDLPPYSEPEDQRAAAQVINAYNWLLKNALNDSELLTSSWKLELSCGRDPRWFIQQVALALLNLTPGDSTSSDTLSCEAAAAHPTSEKFSARDAAPSAGSTPAPKKKWRKISEDKPGEGSSRMPRRAEGLALRILSLPPEDTTMDRVFSEVGICEHIVLGAFHRLYEKRIVPKTLMKVIDEAKTLPREHYSRSALVHTSTLRKSFMRLVEFGVLEQTAYTQANLGEQVVGDAIGSHIPCRFRCVDRYKQQLKSYRLPTEIQSWIQTSNSISW